MSELKLTLSACDIKGTDLVVSATSNWSKHVYITAIPVEKLESILGVASLKEIIETKDSEIGLLKEKIYELEHPLKPITETPA